MTHIERTFTRTRSERWLELREQACRDFPDVHDFLRPDLSEVPESVRDFVHDCIADALLAIETGLTLHPVHPFALAVATARRGDVS